MDTEEKLFDDFLSHLASAIRSPIVSEADADLIRESAKKSLDRYIDYRIEKANPDKLLG